MPGLLYSAGQLRKLIRAILQSRVASRKRRANSRAVRGHGFQLSNYVLQRTAVTTRRLRRVVHRNETRPELSESQTHGLIVAQASGLLRCNPIL